MKMIVTRLDRSRHRVSGMLFDKNLTSDLATEAFKLWRYSSGWSPLTCRFRPIESMASGRDAQGRPVTFVNEEVVRTDPCLIGTELDFDVDESVDQSPPFLLLPDNSGAPACRSARVRLQFSRLSELPDVEGEYQLSRDSLVDYIDRFPEIPEFKERALSMPRESHERLAKAQVTAPGSDIWLPFETGSVQGAMRLGEDRGDGVFDAALYVDRDAETIQPGSLLRRSVTWTTRLRKTGSAEADIATVLEVLFPAETT